LTSIADSRTLVEMSGSDPDPPETKSWLQTNQEFEHDWAKTEQAHHVRWRSGLSIDAASTKQPTQYKAVGALRRKRRWVLGLLTLLIGAAIGVVLLDDMLGLDLRRRLLRLKDRGRRSRSPAHQ
jgi:hypothetical protein